METLFTGKDVHEVSKPPDASEDVRQHRARAGQIDPARRTNSRLTARSFVCVGVFFEEILNVDVKDQFARDAEGRSLLR